jgi:tetratricopeptide (TPR) repeat protein
LLGVHGVESALALGLATPMLAAWLGARVGRDGAAGGASEAIGRALGHALLLLAIPFAILALNQLRVRNCAPLEGLAFVLLGPGVGVLLASFVGLVIGALVKRRRLATTLAVSVPIASALWGLAQFWFSPAIFVYDPFAGWFPGTIYDEDVGLPTSLLTYRAISLAWLGAAITLFSIVWQPAAARPLAWRNLRTRWPRTLLAIALFAFALGGRTQGNALGHRTSVASIDETLGAVRRGERCVVHAPRELSEAQLTRMVEDCDFRVSRAESMLGVTQTTPVHAFFYRDTEEKRRAMGAGSTFIAKPWRDEVHLQLRGWPHPVLAHEVVHVVAGNAARGPFRVSGQLGGYLPNPGFIEGIAVAVEWPSSDGMTPHEWARALREMDRLPPLSDLFGLRFLQHPARDAYATAGSFVRWALDEKGAEAVRAAHRAGDPSLLGSTGSAGSAADGATGSAGSTADGATGSAGSTADGATGSAGSTADGATGSAGSTADGSLVELEAEWNRFLDGIELDPRKLALAELRFSRSSIFATTCPHVLARLQQELGADLAAGDDRRVVRTCREILSIEEGDLGARLALVGALARRGQLDEARAELASLEEGAPAPLVAMAKERLADALWLRGDREAARALYEALLELPQSDDERRGREVKLLAIETGGAVGRHVRDLLVGPDARGVPAPIAVHLARGIADAREDGLGAYLEARQLIQNERWDLAWPLLQVAKERGLPSERFDDELLRMTAISAFALGRLDESRALFETARSRPALRNDANDWLARIAWRVERDRE